MADIYIALGSNIGDRRVNIDSAISMLSKRGFDIVKISDCIETKPYGVTEQADFLNAVLMARTALSPEEALPVLKQIEKDMGRTESVRWGPRLIDLDIIMYGDVIIDSETLKIPHPDMLGRIFVLKPFSQIAGSVIHPVTGKSIDSHLKEIGVDES